MTLLVDAARELIQCLDSAGFRSCLIGGLVMERWGEPEFEREVLDRATPYEFEPGVGLATCSAEDLIVYKAVAGRPRDIDDIRSDRTIRTGSLQFWRSRFQLSSRVIGDSESDASGQVERSTARAQR